MTHRSRRWDSLARFRPIPATLFVRAVARASAPLPCTDRGPAAAGRPCSPTWIFVATPQPQYRSDLTGLSLTTIPMFAATSSDESAPSLPGCCNIPLDYKVRAVTHRFCLCLVLQLGLIQRPVKRRNSVRQSLEHRPVARQALVVQGKLPRSGPLSARSSLSAHRRILNRDEGPRRQATRSSCSLGDGKNHTRDRPIAQTNTRRRIARLSIEGNGQMPVGCPSSPRVYSLVAEARLKRDADSVVGISPTGDGESRALALSGTASSFSLPERHRHGTPCASIVGAGWRGLRRSGGESFFNGNSLCRRQVPSDPPRIRGPRNGRASGARGLRVNPP